MEVSTDDFPESKNAQSFVEEDDRTPYPSSEPSPDLVDGMASVTEETLATDSPTSTNPNPNPENPFSASVSRSSVPEPDPNPLSDRVDGVSPVEYCGESFCENDGERYEAPYSEEVKSVLLAELSKSVVHLECESLVCGGSCDVYLVGTAHVSQESCREVQAIIHHLKPQVVFLELCSSRVSLLTPQNLQVPTMSEMLDMWKKKHMNVFGILYSWFLAKVADKLEVFPGSEFRVAYEEAMTYGAKVILGDRPVQITLRRTWGKMTLWHKTKFLYHLFTQAIFLPSPDELNKMLKDMDDVDMLTLVIQEMSKTFPTLMETLVYERDLYMSATLLKVAREHTSVVAVVGKGHLSGIKKNWKQLIEVRSLLEVPEKNQGWSSMKIWASFGVAVTGVAIFSGIYLAGKR